MWDSAGGTAQGVLGGEDKWPTILNYVGGWQWLCYWSLRPSSDICLTKSHYKMSF